MDLTFLGTASAYPSPTRGVSCIVYRNEGVYWMFDCGEGSQIQIQRSTLRCGKLSKIFITHLHGDHVFGLPGLMCTIATKAGPEESRGALEVYGPVGLRRYLRTSLLLSQSMLGFDYIVHELLPISEQLTDDLKGWPEDHEANYRLHPNEQLGCTITADEMGVWHVFEDDTHTIKASWLRHRVPSFGFTIQEKPLPGRLDPSILKAKGVPPGPLYAKIKAGQTITAPSGEVIVCFPELITKSSSIGLWIKTVMVFIVRNYIPIVAYWIHPEDAVGPARPGRLVALLGDSSDSSQMEALCRDADVIVHEATLEDAKEAEALEKGHSTPGMAGRFARGVCARNLILTHFSQRYKAVSAEEDGSGDDSSSVKLLVQQAQEAFESANVTAADDLLTIPVPARQA